MRVRDEVKAAMALRVVVRHTHTHTHIYIYIDIHTSHKFILWMSKTEELPLTISSFSFSFFSTFRGRLWRTPWYGKSQMRRDRRTHTHTHTSACLHLCRRRESMCRNRIPFLFQIASPLHTLSYSLLLSVSLTPT